MKLVKIGLKWRDLYKVAVAYSVVGWLLIQITTQVFPFFELPHWSVRLVIIVLALGFPMVLIFGWVRSLPSQSLKTATVADAISQSGPEDPASANKGKRSSRVAVRVALVILGLLAICGFTASAILNVFKPQQTIPGLTAGPAPEESTTDGAILNVNPQGTDGAYLHVADALRAAQSGDTINIAAGEYRGEKLVLVPKDRTKPLWNITIQGVGRDDVIISGRPDVPATRDPIDSARYALFRIDNSYNVTIAGITFESEPGAAITSSGDLLHIHDADVNIRECRFRWSSNAAIAQHYSGSLFIDQTLVDSNRGAGIEGRGNSLAITTYRSTFSSNGTHGIDLANGTIASIEEAVISDNARDGVYLEGAHAKVKLLESTLSRNVYDGILVTKGAEAAIISNALVNNGTGVALRQTGEDIRVIGNSCTGNSYSGLVLDNVASAEIRSNLFAANGSPVDGSVGYGVYAQQCGSRVSLKRNFLRENSNIGLAIVGPNAGIIDDLLVESNKQGGIWFWGTKPFPRFTRTYIFNQPKASCGFYGVPSTEVEFQNRIWDKESASAVQSSK